MYINVHVHVHVYDIISHIHVHVRVHYMCFLFSRLPIEISFTAVDKREFIFHLTCNIKKKPTPLTLNVKADVFAISLSLSATDTNGREIALPVDRMAQRTIDFGTVRCLYMYNVYMYM